MERQSFHKQQDQPLMAGIHRWMRMNDGNDFALVLGIGIASWVHHKMLVWRCSQIATGEITPTTFHDTN